MIRTVDDLCNDIKNFSKEQYAKGVHDVLDLLNEKYLIKVWHKEDAEKLFDDFFDTLRDLNVRYAKYSNKLTKQE